MDTEEKPVDLLTDGRNAWLAIVEPELDDVDISLVHYQGITDILTGIRGEVMLALFFYKKKGT